MEEPDRAGKGRLMLEGAGKGWMGPARAGKGWEGPARAGIGRQGLGGAGKGWGWAGWGWVEMARTGKGLLELGEPAGVERSLAGSSHPYQAFPTR